MKALLSFAFLFTSVAANADIIKCTFTEPFLTVTYSMTQSKLTIDDAFEDSDYNVVEKNVSFQIKGQNQFQLFDKNNKVIMNLRLDFQGSDGMSNRVYPYSAELVGKKSWANLGFGGCESNFLHALNQDELP